MYVFDVQAPLNISMRLDVYIALFRSKLILDGSLRRGDAGDGYAEGGAGYVVHAEFGAELH